MMNIVEQVLPVSDFTIFRNLYLEEALHKSHLISPPRLRRPYHPPRLRRPYHRRGFAAWCEGRL